MRPAANGAIQIYRDERLQQNNAQQQAQPGYFLADAVAGSVQVSGLFKRLIPEETLRGPSERPVDHAARAAARRRSARHQLRHRKWRHDRHDQRGERTAECGHQPRLRLLRGAISTHQPGSSTWDFEMHQVYRLDSSSDVDPNSVDLKISLGDLSGGRIVP